MQTKAYERIQRLRYEIIKLLANQYNSTTPTHVNKEEVLSINGAELHCKKVIIEKAKEPTERTEK